MNDRTVTIDGKRIFGDGQHCVRAMSWRRESVERGFAGADGVVSVDLGLRDRKLKQQGYLAADSTKALARVIESVSSYIDGHAYQLVDQDGTTYANVRMDSFKSLGTVQKASQVRCEYEIVYTQLSS